MVSEVGPALAPVAGLVHGSQTPVISKAQDAGGNTLPQPRQAAATAAAAQRAAVAAQAANQPLDLEAQIAALNKYLNDSGEPNQYRIAPQSGNKLIQEINPANGKVLGEFPASEFPLLAASAGLSGVLVNERA